MQGVAPSLAMDPRRTHPTARDPGTPERVRAPSIDEHVVKPESREELLRGRKLYAAPALPEHGDPHFRLDVALGTHAKSGYVGSTDLLSRVADDGDFATDTCIRREGIDPATGHRYLEEMAFEVVNTQRLSDVTAKAEELSARGVRRIFAVFVRKRVVSEWRDGDWEPLPDDARIEDDCLAAPLPVEALLRSSALGAAAVRGLLARGEPELKRLLAEHEAEGRARGEAEGRARGEAEGRADGEARGRAREALSARRSSLRILLEARHIAINAADEARIDACGETATLDGWILRAANATERSHVFD